MTYRQRPVDESPMTPTEVMDLMRRPAWMAVAHCASEDAETLAWTLDLDDTTELFVRPLGRGRRARAELQAAKDICAACPVCAECLAYALEHGERGIWGGTTDQERKQITKGRTTT